MKCQFCFMDADSNTCKSFDFFSESLLCNFCIHIINVCHIHLRYTNEIYFKQIEFGFFHVISLIFLQDNI